MMATSEIKVHQQTDHYLHYEVYVGWWIKCSQCDGREPGHRALLTNASANLLLTKGDVRIGRSA